MSVIIGEGDTFTAEVVEVTPFKEVTIWPKLAMFVGYPAIGLGLMIFMIPLTQYFKGFAISFDNLSDTQFMKMAALGLIIFALIVGYVVLFFGVRKWYLHFYPCSPKSAMQQWGIRFRRHPAPVSTVPPTTAPVILPDTTTATTTTPATTTTIPATTTVPVHKKLILFIEDLNNPGRLLLLHQLVAGVLTLLTDERRLTMDARIPDEAFEEVNLGIADVNAIRLNITDRALFDSLFVGAGGGLVPNVSPGFIRDHHTGMGLPDLIFSDWLLVTGATELQARDALRLLSTTDGHTI